jgi:hypothetical protein
MASATGTPIKIAIVETQRFSHRFSPWDVGRISVALSASPALSRANAKSLSPRCRTAHRTLKGMTDYHEINIICGHMASGTVKVGSRSTGRTSRT